MLTTTQNLNKLAAAYMVAAISAIVEHTTERILKVDREDGSGRKFIVTTGNYEAYTYYESNYYVEVSPDMTTKVIRLQDMKIKQLS